MHHTPKKVTCIGCISITKVASHLQRMIFRLQKLRFAYKYLIVRLQNCISGYKTASRFAIEYLLISIEMYRLEEEKAINRLAEVLTAYGVDVTEEQVRRADAEEIKEKVNESRSRQEEEDEEQDEKEKSGQYAPKCTLREPVL